MKASELITALQDGIKLNGDLRVDIFERNETGWTLEEVKTVGHDDSHSEAFIIGT